MALAAAAGAAGQTPDGGLPLEPPLPPAGLPETGVPEGGQAPAVGVRSTPPRERAQVKTLPVGPRPGARPVAVSSLSLAGLGRLRRGVGLDVAGELQVTVCLRPESGPRRRRGDCVGRVYDYDPRIRARLALAADRRATGRGTYTIGRARTLNCRQRQPNRNHHCTLSLPWRRITLGSERGMPACAPRSCRLNLIASAADRRAGPRHRVAVGGIDKRGRIDNRGETRIAAVLYRRRAEVAEPHAARAARSRRLPLVGDGRKIRPSVVYSVPVPGLRAGERLKVDGLHSGRIGRLPFNLRTRTRLVLADSPTAVAPGPRSRAVTRGSAYVSAVSNFNCTRGPSGHRSPCPIRKAGVLRIGRDSDVPLYVNLLAGYGAIGTRSHRHRRSDRVRVGRGFVKVWRYPR